MRIQLIRKQTKYERLSNTVEILINVYIIERKSYHKGKL